MNDNFKNKNCMGMFRDFGFHNLLFFLMNSYYIIRINMP